MGMESVLVVSWASMGMLFWVGVGAVLMGRKMLLSEWFSLLSGATTMMVGVLCIELFVGLATIYRLIDEGGTPRVAVMAFLTVVIWVIAIWIAFSLVEMQKGEGDHLQT